VWSSEEWGIITGGNRPTTDTPSWLQVLTLVFLGTISFIGDGTYHRKMTKL